VSIAATDYALTILALDTKMGSPPRLALMLLAGRANVKTGETYTGGWLAKAMGDRDRSTVWRALGILETSGYIIMRRRPGRATVIAFPQPVAESRRVEDGEQAFARRDFATHPSRFRDTPVAETRRVSGLISESVSVAPPAVSDADLDAIHDPGVRAIIARNARRAT
jgi:hypothetical protein